MAGAMVRAAGGLMSVISCCSTGSIGNGVQKSEAKKSSRVMVLGGTGRIGGSTCVALSEFCPDARIIVAGRNMEKGNAMVNRLGANSEFFRVDIDDQIALENALRDVDLVVHAAGPFQQAQNCNVLEAAIQTNTAYLDVCDDTNYALRAKSYKDKAIAANIPAITTGGIYPGVSNVMAAELVRIGRSQAERDPTRLRFNYYTAGSGGAGPTILATSFLLLGEDVIAYSRGEKLKLKPYSGMLNVDFGNGVKKKNVYLLNLPEVYSAHEILKIPTVSARFGTAPFFWNWGMEVIAKFVPREILRDREKVQSLVKIFDPLVRSIDGIIGERVSMRVDLEWSDGRSSVAIFTHRKLSVSVGIATAAFAAGILEGSTQAGVWFPEEPEGIAVEAREVLLKRAAKGTLNFVMNMPPWMVETEPKEVGLGIYL